MVYLPIESYKIIRMKIFIKSVCISIVAVFVLSFKAYCVLQTNGNFKYWSCNQSTAFGIYKVEKTAGKKYFKIASQDDISQIEEYNPKGLIVGTIIIKFQNGNIVSLTEADRWHYVFKIKKYVQLAEHEFMVTEMIRGLNSNLPCKGVKYTYANGVLEKETFLSFDDKPMKNNDGVAIIKYKKMTDEANFSLTKEIEYFDENERPVFSAEKDCHKISYDHDSKGNTISKAIFDTAFIPVKSRYGVSKTTYEYDINDNKISEAYFDINDNAANNVYGVSVIRYIYENGLCAGMKYFDDKDKVSASGKVLLGSSLVKYSYDDNGNETDRTYYDENEWKNLSNEGYHEMRHKYSDLNMLTETSVYNIYGSPINDKEGIHKWFFVHDDYGRIIQTSFYDKDYKPAKNRIDQVNMIKYRYDDMGRILSQSYWLDEDRKINRWDGYHENMWKYNDLGQLIESSKLDTNGQLVKSQEGYSKQILTYNNKSEIVENGYYDGNAPVNVSNSSRASIRNFHSIKYAYDNQNRTSSIAYYDDKNEPTDATIGLDKTNTFKCHKIEFIYRGTKIISENCFALDDTTPMKIIDCYNSDYVSYAGNSTNKKIVNK